MNIPIPINPDYPCPAEILTQLTTLEVVRINCDDERRHGLIEAHTTLADDVKSFFELAVELKFPIEKVVRSSDAPYFWDDDKMMADNATSGFNYRSHGVHPKQLSNHSLGRAIDINTRLNPFIRMVDGRRIIAPETARWDPSVPGTLTADHPLVKFMESRGWSWGGNWTYQTAGAIDYQHFEKII